MKFLVDENAPIDLVAFLQSRGHEADYVGDAFPKSSPDALLLFAAELHGYVVVTFDKDMKRMLRQVPAGHRSKVRQRAGRISFSCPEVMALSRLEEMIEEIEALHVILEAKGKRFIVQISTTGMQVVR